MKNNITELVFILDRSGSMYGKEEDTVGGFNSLLEQQKTEGGKVLVDTVLFDDDMVTIHDRVDINDVKPMTKEDYEVGGCTALLDTVGATLEHIGEIHKYIRREDVPEHVIVAITTDGLENASRKYTYDMVRAAIKAKEELGWKFIFMAANMDEKAEGARLGVSADDCMSFCIDEPEEVRASFDCLSRRVTGMRMMDDDDLAF